MLAERPPVNGASAPRPHDPAIPSLPESVFHYLEATMLRELADMHAVNRLPEGTRFRGLKRLFARSMRMFTGPQSVYNYRNIEAHRTVAIELDRTNAVATALRSALIRIDESSRNEIAVMRSDFHAALRSIEDRAAQHDVEKIYGEIANLYKSINERGNQQDVEKLFREVETLYKVAGARASQKDVEKLFADVANLNKATMERATQADIVKLFREVENLNTATAERATQADVEKLFAEIPNIYRSIEERGSQEDVEKLFDDLAHAYASIDQRAHQTDIVKMWQQFAKLETALQDRPHRLDLNALWRAYESQDARRIEEFRLVYQSVEDRLIGVWKGIGERDEQIKLVTDAIQSLQTNVAKVSTLDKELNAQMLFLSEQVSLLNEAGPSAAQAIAPIGSGSPRPPIATTGIDPAIQQLLDLIYLRFQRQYRGDEAELRDSQKPYVEMLAHIFGRVEKPRVVDAACGDGIFVEMLQQRGWDALGVDSGEAMVRHAQKKRLPVVREDAIAYLENTPPQSLDAITAFQFIEHLEPAPLLSFLKAGFRALKPGGAIIMETINPHTLKALHWFHLDLTHARLVFPEMLQLLAEGVGFQEVRWEGIHPVAESERLRASHGGADFNIDRLNKLLFGDQDYYLVARRPQGNK
ncbi:hypothetical protein BH09SUM1_BH09SUM1_04210 [soil metagenome]